MAFNSAPTSLWPSYASDGTTISIDIADLTELTAAEAHATTGDWRAVSQAISATLWDHYNGLAAADKPEAFIASKPTQAYQSAGTFADKTKVGYTVSYYLTLPGPSAGTMADEP